MENEVKGKKKFYKRWWFWVIVVIVIFWIIGAQGSPSNSGTAQTATTTQQAPQVPAIQVTATQLISDYQANEVSADAKYKDKTVQVTGTIQNIGKDILDNPYVALSGNSSDLITSVQCMFDKSDEGQLATLSKDKKITLQGKVSGKLGNVLINGCSIVQ